jgi:hypothetical protein
VSSGADLKWGHGGLWIHLNLNFFFGNELHPKLNREPRGPTGANSASLLMEKRDLI